MIIPSSVTDSITAAGIDVSNDWLSATAPVWNDDYSAVLTQPISIAATPLADMRFLGVTTATIVIRISSAPLSLVSWSGIATLVADDTTGGGSPIYPVHNSFTGRDVADTHPLASITGLVDALDSKAPAFVSDGARLFWATPNGAPGVPLLRAIAASDLPALPYIPTSGVSGATDRVAYFTGVNSVGSDSGFRIFKNLGKTYQLRIGDGVTNQGTELGLDSDAANSCFIQCFEAGNMKWSFGRAAPDNAFIISNSGNRPIEIANSATGTIKFGAGGRLVEVVSSLKIGSLAGTLIGTAGNVSALSGTELVLGNGTTIPQSTFATAIPSGAQNLVLATPTAGSGTAALRSLVAADIPILNSLGNIAGAGPNIILSATDGYLRIGSTPVAHFGTTGFGLDQIYSYDLADFWLSKSSSGPYPRSQLMMAAAFYTGSAGSELKVVDARRTGWTAATGTATRTTFATSTVTLPQLAEHVKALLDDLIAHGLIGA